MEIAKIYVNGTMAAVSGLKKIPKGITGATIAVTFGNDWSGLTKTAVFQGAVTKDVLDIENVITIPAECVEQSGHRLKVGFYGVASETLVIPTLWADLGTIQDAADPSGDTSTDPELPIWAQIQEQIKKLEEGQATGKPAVTATARIAEINLLAGNWVGGANQYSQVVEVEGATENSQVNITPSVEQLVIFYEKDLTFVTENDGGVVTVYAIGQKPTNDYTIQVTITEVTV